MIHIDPTSAALAVFLIVYPALGMATYWIKRRKGRR